ncbi:hypothetical protein ASE90_05220 [Sphingomonas sp. Leaf67]|uniref:hypothetical protein n=1 Tax=Sphingomonas sp. Leaf67 TaxID=1736230 RepID=UPI0006F7CA84|nr:hypothetical protein [Sphingomonas sp. Leaf67]KQN92130.1 hypothetical protein ASE90_05220 [Sphingomonas sp. Leaf67]
MKKALLLAASVVLASSAHAQTATVAPAAPATAVVVRGDASVLRAGTSVVLRTLDGLTTEGKKLKVGQRFNLEVAEAVQVNGVTVIPVGAHAVGEVTDIRNKGMWGKSGRIGARLVYVETNGRRLRLSGQMDDKGVTGTAGVVGAIALVPVAGFFMTGTSARIPAGSNITGYLDEDVPVAFTGTTAPAPMVVQTSSK